MEPPEKKRLLMPTESEGSLQCELIQDQKQIADFENFSILERLPADLFWKIIEYVPGDVCRIRIVSST